MKFLLKLLVLLVVVVVAIGIYIVSGRYDIGADAPHWAVTKHVLSAVREHSIEARAKQVQVPTLDSPAMVAEGADHYAEMCTGCHLAPGMRDSELRTGLYPQPPDLTRFAPDPAEAFWVIKHGIKFTAMPAWGKTHSDDKIWAIVAYLQKQPDMSEARYRELTAHAGNDEDAAPPGGAPAPAASTAVPAAAATSR